MTKTKKISMKQLVESIKPLPNDAKFYIAAMAEGMALMAELNKKESA